MRNRIIAGLCLVSAIAAFFVYKAYAGIPQRLEHHLQNTFQNIGITDASIPEATKQNGAWVYKNITLDPDGFSKIGTLRLQFSPFKLMTGGALRSIKVEDLELTGELKDGQNLSLAGLNTNTFSTSIAIDIKAQNIQFENARIAVLSENAGGINLNFDLQMTRQGGAFKFQSKIQGSQKQLSYTANADGQINADHTWQSTVEVEQAKVDLPSIKASRIAGVLNISGHKQTRPQIIGELRAGGLSVFDMPWQNASITIDKTLPNPRMIIGAKSLGFEGIELGLTMPEIMIPNILSGNIHTESVSTFLNFLEKTAGLPIKREQLSLLEPLKNINFAFEMHQSDIKFSITNAEQSLVINTLVSSKDDNAKNIQITGSSLSLPAFSKGKNTTFKTGEALLNGTLTLKDKTVSGPLKAGMNNLSLNFGSIPLENMNGDIAYEDVKDIKSAVTSPLSCKIRGLALDHECSIQMRLNKKGATLSALELSGDAFSIVSAPPRENGQHIITVQSLNIAHILKIFGENGWNGSGVLDGTIIARTSENSGLIIEKMNLQANEGGIISIKDERFFKLLDMEELEIETIKLALDNFHYDLLEIRGKGTAPDNIEFSIFGKGKNPDLMGGRPFSVDMKLTPDLSPFITKAFAP